MPGDVNGETVEDIVKEAYQNIEKGGELPEETKIAGEPMQLQSMLMDELPEDAQKGELGQKVREMIEESRKKQMGDGEIGADGVCRKVLKEEEIPMETRELVHSLQAHELSRIDNRHNPALRFDSKHEKRSNIKDPELEKGDVMAETELLIERSKRMNLLAQELIYLQDWYQDLPGMKHMPRHGLQLTELIDRPQKQTKGLRRAQPPRRSNGVRVQRRK
jgi:hypothetical protein